MTVVLTERETDGHTRRRPSEDRDSDWSQETPQIASNHQKQGGGQERPRLRAFRGNMALPRP